MFFKNCGNIIFAPKSKFNEDYKYSDSFVKIMIFK